MHFIYDARQHTDAEILAQAYLDYFYKDKDKKIELRSYPQPLQSRSFS